jgi:predicted unusual protein kinase regulating ubiquinone biosynthesis (AarF/ABC1/UbiB family)/nucleotide-binding universal stress UspA family protein
VELVAGAHNPRRVMVATDRSETAEQAVRWAASFADRFGAELHLVQVVVPQHAADTESGAAERIRTAASADDLVQHARSIAGDRGRGRIILDEDPAMAIVRAAEEDVIDVLVVGNAGMAGRKEFLLGNVPNRISHNARCTVIIVNTLGNDGRNSSPRAARARNGTQDEEAQPNRAARASKIAAVFAKHGLRELFGQPDEEGSIGRHRQAKRLRAALEELGPTFVKIGQILSTRPDLLPPEFINELVQLQDRVTPLTEEQVVRVMEQDLGVPWEDVFETIEPEPLAAGTIAQVHRAGLASGDKVVVKIQRPGAKGLIEQDLALLKLFAEKAGSWTMVRRSIDVPAVFEHLSTSLRGELDFQLEAGNAERMGAVLNDFPRLAVPKIYRDFSTSRLLVMQDVAGVPTRDIPAGRIRKETARQIVESFCKQILIEGFFHADPHPGNLMWQPVQQRLYLLDLGMVGEVGTGMRELLILLLTAFWQKDADLLTEVLLMLSGVTDQGTLNMEAFRQQIHSLIANYRGGSVKNIQLGPVLEEVIATSFRHGVPLPASLTLAAKALAQMQLVAAQLDPEIDPFDVAGWFLMGSIFRRMVTKSDPKTLFYQSQKMKVRAMRLFEALERLVGARPGPRLSVDVHVASLEETVRRVARRLGLGLTAGFAILASALTAISDRVEVWVPMTLGLAGAAFTVALVVDLLRRREYVKKFSFWSAPWQGGG